MFFQHLFTFLQQLPNWLNLEEVLLWLAAGGGAVVVAFFFSWLAENFVFWHNFSANLKLFLSLVFSVGIGVGAHYVLGLPDLITFISPTYTLIITILLTWLGSQTAYMRSRYRDYGVHVTKT